MRLLRNKETSRKNFRLQNPGNLWIYNLMYVLQVRRVQIVTGIREMLSNPKEWEQRNLKNCVKGSNIANHAV